jgi:DNA-binding response OmpR family regulator
LVSHADPQERRQASSPLRVLIADDDRDTVVTLSALLQAEGYDVLEVYRGDAVLELVRRYPPHAVLLDIGMPGLTGFQIARRLRDELGHACPLLVAITAWGQAAAREMGRLSGFHHYLVKPYAPDELLALLQPLAST